MDQNYQTGAGQTPSNESGMQTATPTGNYSGRDYGTMPIEGSAKSGKKVGPIVAILVIVLILIIAAVYLFASKLNKNEAPIENTAAPLVQNQVTTEQTANLQETVPPVTNTADDPDTLSKDLNSATAGLDSQGF